MVNLSEETSEDECFVVARYEGDAACKSEFSDRKVSASEHRALVEGGAIASLPRLLGVRLRVIRLESVLRPGVLKDNTAALHLMADPESGITGWPWQPVLGESGGLGAVDVVREDGDFTSLDAGALHEFLGAVLGTWNILEDEKPVLTVHAFQNFLRDHDFYEYKNSEHFHLRLHRIQLRGLSSGKNKNGQRGFLGSYFRKSQRFAVYLDSDPDRGVSVKPANVSLLDDDGQNPAPMPTPLPEAFLRKQSVGYDDDV